MSKNPHSFDHGDLAKIARSTGYSKNMVWRVLVGGDRHNETIVQAAQKVIEFNQSLKTA